MEKKFYTTMKTFPCVGKNNAPYTGITVVLALSNIQQKDANGKKLVTARGAINNRTKLLNQALGTSFPETDETVWVDVNFWEERADRFLKFLGDREKVLVGIMGSASARKFKRTDETEGESIAITADDWFGMGGNNPAPKEQAASVPTVNDDELPY